MYLLDLGMCPDVRKTSVVPRIEMKKGTFMYVWDISEGYNIYCMCISILVYKTINLIYCNYVPSHTLKNIEHHRM